MAKIAIVYHSGFGHTKVQAEAVARGAGSVEGTTVLFLTSEEATANLDLLADADTIIFGSPTYMGSASAPFKAFMDASSKIWFTQGWKNKLAAGFTNSASRSGDKLHTLIELVVFAAQHGMIWISLDLHPGNNTSMGSEEDLNRLGGSLGAMAQSNADQGPDLAPPASDQRTAEYHGKHVAEITKTFVAGKAI